MGGLDDGDVLRLQGGNEVVKGLDAFFVHTGSRLVEQQHLWLQHQSPGYRNPLLLTPGEFPGIAPAEAGQADQVEGVMDAPVLLVTVDATDLQAVGKVRPSRCSASQRWEAGIPASPKPTSR